MTDDPIFCPRCGCIRFHVYLQKNRWKAALVPLVCDHCSNEYKLHADGTLTLLREPSLEEPLHPVVP